MLDPASARIALLTRQTELRAREERLGAHLRNRGEPLSADSGEQALELENEEVLRGLDASEHAELEQISRALTRIDQGTWGVCTSCGGAIDPGRLAALPSADRCLDCAD